MEEMEIMRSEQPAETQTEENGSTEQVERTFTQEQVNRIVKERLDRERAKAAEITPELQQKLADLDARESRLACREYLAESGMPSDLLEILDTSDPEAFRIKAEKVYSMRVQRLQESPRFSSERIGDSIADSFADTRHKPKGTNW